MGNTDPNFPFMVVERGSEREISSSVCGGSWSDLLENFLSCLPQLQGSIPLTTTALQSALPEVRGHSWASHPLEILFLSSFNASSLLSFLQLSQLLPADLPLVVKIRVLEVPTVSLQNGQVTVALTANAEVFARTRAGLRALFGVDAVSDNQIRNWG